MNPAPFTKSMTIFLAERDQTQAELIALEKELPELRADKVKLIEEADAANADGTIRQLALVNLQSAQYVIAVGIFGLAQDLVFNAAPRLPGLACRQLCPRQAQSGPCRRKA